MADLDLKESAPPARPRRRRRPKAPLWQRALLGLTSLLVTSLVLEIAARILWPLPPVVQLRDRIYVHALPLVNGRNTVPSVAGSPLPEAKRPGEKRVFVFGESSVEGGPWGYPGGPVTMLHDQLRARLPGDDVTIVNMGRGAGTALDSYYFLLSIRRYAPDVVIFYQGGNDFFSVDRERCLPSTHPLLHRAFRALVERSHLVWTLRARGPSYVASLGGQAPAGGGAGGSDADLCEEHAGFAAWADLLVSTARSMGAQVITVSPVQNPLRWAERSGRWGVEHPLSLGDKDEAYKRLLGCVLAPGCDLPAAFAEEEAAARYRSPWMAERRDAWKRASSERAFFIDFGENLAAHAHRGLAPPMFSDEVHLTFDGYWRLAWLWSKEVEAVLHGRAPEGDAPPPLDTARYLGAVTRRARKTGACILLADAEVYLRADMPLLAASILRLAADQEAQLPTEPARSRAGRVAQLILGKLRRDLGEDPALPALLAPRLDALDLRTLSAELRDHPDCSTAGGLDFPAAPEPEEDLGDESTSYMIPGGQDALIGQMLGGSPGGCSLDRASVPGSRIEAWFRCPDGTTAAVELHHPSTLLPALASTQRFLIRAGQPPPSPALVEALAATIRERESAFTWKRDGSPQSAPATPDKPAPRSRSGLFAVGILLGAAALALGVMARRRRITNRND